MRSELRANTHAQLTTAINIMTPNPKSVGEDATIRQVALAMQKYGIHSAPVIDAAGRPQGVITRTDIIEYWNGRRINWFASLEQLDGPRSRSCEPGDELTVRDIMTPVLFHVSQDASIDAIIDKMLALEVRHVFVADEQGIPIGTISVFDVLRHIAQDRPRHKSQRLKRASYSAKPNWELPTKLRI
jgi:CBS domain-containing protein